eukprot:TRINITY_DN42218_c0_g1_i1.p1 TRINITY_DN42218_c0_g1~~TRINITY_DN42218_c0_g1_i1.p1  ORF type:complete len:1335 (+),score=199.78 TRINITY_DN42218_c0_g1_i1:125-4129(+)
MSFWGQRWHTCFLFTLIGLYFFEAQGARLTLLETQNILEEKIARALESGDTRPCKTRNASDTSPVSEEEFWQGELSGLHNISMKADEDFRRETWNILKNSWKPDVRVYICMQVSIDLSALIMIPGIYVDMGFQGGITYNTQNGCWGLSLEVSLGFSWLFKRFGYVLGVGIHSYGSVDLNEHPPRDVIEDPEATDSKVYAPADSDLSRCHVRSPWAVLQAFIQHQYRRTANSSQASEELARLQEEQQATAEQFQAQYMWLISGVIQEGPAVGSTKLIHAPRLHAPAVALLDTAQLFVRSLPGYAAQVLERLTDNTDRFGTDGEFCRFRQYSCQRIKGSSGRFLARWPSKARLKEFDEDAYVLFVIEGCGDDRANGKWVIDSRHRGRPSYKASHNSSIKIYWSKKRQSWRLVVDTTYTGHWRKTLYQSRVDSATIPATGWEAVEGTTPAPTVSVSPGLTHEELQGVSKARNGSDQRVMNFPKMMRLSTNQNDPQFWKELALSAGNLMVRVVADSKAVFGAVFAEDANWDGNCESLPVNATVRTSLDEVILKEYQWASRSTDEATRSNFRKLNPLDMEFRVPALSSLDSKMYAHLWCMMAEEAPRSNAFYQPFSHEYFANANEPFAVYVSQACQTVVHDARKLEITDTLLWDDLHSHYKVIRGNVTEGVLSHDSQDVCQACMSNLEGVDAVTEAQRKGFLVSTKIIDARPECERTSLPVVFQRTFPRFAALVHKMVQKMEELLLDLGACLDEVLDSRALEPDHDGKASDGKQKSRVLCRPEQRLERARSKGQEAVQMVRQLLLELGAGGKDDSVLSALTAEGRGVFLAVEEMWWDFTDLFAVGPPSKAEFVQDWLATFQRDEEPQRADMILQGRFWQYFSKVESRIVQTAASLRNLSNLRAVQLSPHVEIMSGLSVSAAANSNNFCDRRAAVLAVQYTYLWTRYTWSLRSSHERCYIGRLRPGDTYIAVFRCEGTNGRSSDEFGKYVDWRVRFVSNLMSGDLLDIDHMGGVFGGLFTATNGVLPTFFFQSIAVAGGAASMRLVDKITPGIIDSKIESMLLMTLATALPFAGTLGMAVAVASVRSFHGICSRFLAHLSHRGLIAADLTASRPGPQKLLFVGENKQPDIGQSNSYGLKTAIQFLFSVVHRQKKIRPNSSLLTRLSDPKADLVRTQRFFSSQLIYKNGLNAQFPLPGIVAIRLQLTLHLEFDVTQVLERLQNAKLFKEHKQRMEGCVKCLQQGMAFCDWKFALQSLWKEDDDICIPDTPENNESCTSDTGIFDDWGHPIRASYISRTQAGKYSTCQAMVFHRANQELLVNQPGAPQGIESLTLRRFFDRI